MEYNVFKKKNGIYLKKSRLLTSNVYFHRNKLSQRFRHLRSNIMNSKRRSGSYRVYGFRKFRLVEAYKRYPHETHAF